MAPTDPFLFRFGFIVLLCLRYDFPIELVGCSEERDFDVKSSWNETYPERNGSTTFTIDAPWATKNYTELTTVRGGLTTADLTFDELYYTPKPSSSIVQNSDIPSERSDLDEQKTRKALEGSDYTIRCSRVGDIVWNVKWWKDGKPIVFGGKIVPEKYQDVIRIQNFGPKDVGEYSCSANTRYGVHKNRVVIRPDEVPRLPSRVVGATTKRSPVNAAATKSVPKTSVPKTSVPRTTVPTKPPPDIVYITRCTAIVSRRTAVSYDETETERRQMSDTESQVHEFVVNTNSGADAGNWRCTTEKVEESDAEPETD